MAPHLVSDDSSPPRPAILTPAPALLPPSIPACTIGHLALWGSLGQSAPPGMDITTPSLWTCMQYATLRPSILRPPPPSSVTPAHPLASGYPPTPRPPPKPPPSFPNCPVLSIFDVLWLLSVCGLSPCGLLIVILPIYSYSILPHIVIILPSHILLGSSYISLKVTGCE